MRGWWRTSSWWCWCWLGLALGKRRNEETRIGNTDDNNKVMAVLRGLSLSLDPQLASSSLIQKWARELGASRGSVSHSDAVSREQYVVNQVNTDKLPARAYFDYQRFAAGTGNVDSAALLLEYGIGATVQSIPAGGLLDTVRACRIKEYLLRRRISSDEDEQVMPDGTNVLLVATFVNCLPIVKAVLDDAGGSTTDHLIEHTGLNGMTPMMMASACGHVDIILELARRGARLNSRHKFGGNSPLHFASELDQAAACSALCRLGQGQQQGLGEARTTLGATPLHVAAQKNASAATVTALVTECGADVDALLNNDTTPLYLAAQGGCLGAISCLINNGADVNFMMPVTEYRGSLELTLSAADAGAGSINAEAGNGAQAVHAAAENGHPAALELLLKNGSAHIDSLTIGTSPLHLAVQYRHLPCVEVLLKRGANVDIRSRLDGATPLYAATGRGLLEITRALLAAGANCMLTGRGGGTPLLYATLQGHTELVSLLLHARMDCGGRSLWQAGHDGLTPIAAAIILGHVDVVEQLLRCAPDRGRGLRLAADGTNGDIYTPLQLAATHAQAGVVAVLLEQGHDARVTVTGRPSLTPLLLAVQSGSAQSVNLLLQAAGYLRPPPAAFFHQQDSSLLLAIDKNLSEIVELLLRAGGTDAANEGLESPQAGIYQHPLLLAVVRGHVSLVTLLLIAGARCDILVASAREPGATSTLVDIARQKRLFDVLQALLKEPRCSLDSTATQQELVT